MTNPESRSTVGFAKQLRKRQTDAERHLWYRLRAHRLLDLKFERQKPLGPYIADFVCLEHRLVIELDGGQHNIETLDRDHKRDKWLRAQGYRVLRFWNDEVLHQTESVLERIRETLALAAAPSPLTPLPRAREGNQRDESLNRVAAGSSAC